MTRDLPAFARRALACLDLTNLDADCDEAAISTLCRRARTPRGPVAAVCVWPRFAAQARGELDGSGIGVATVVNFPGGDEPIAKILSATSAALGSGAEEIDLVVPWRALADGHSERVTDLVRAIKAVCGPARLKAILETGELREPALIRRAAEAALEGGADFLKTSTGKVPVNATPEAAEIMLLAIRDSGRDVGLKPAGVRDAQDAAVYLEICDRIMGPDWATPAHFRIGASGVLSALLATIDAAAEGRSLDGATPSVEGSGRY